MIVREFYQLPALAERWGCSVPDLLHLGVQDRLQICANIYGMAVGMHRTRICFEDEEGGLLEQQSEEDRIEAEEGGAAFEAWLARTTRNMPHGVFELHPESLRFMEMPGGIPFELFEARKFDEGWWYVDFDPPVLVSLDHLCVLHEEVSRIDGLDLENLHLEARADEAESALDSQLEALHMRFLAFAEASRAGYDHEKLIGIGNWQRIVMLDRTEGGDQYLSCSDSALLLKADGVSYVLDGDQTNFDWIAADVSERLVGFGLHVYVRVIAGEASVNEAMHLFGLASEIMGSLSFRNLSQNGDDALANLARFAANVRHSKPGGSREKRKAIQEIWKTGKYTSRDICAEQECAVLEMSFSSARKALRGTADPT
jgi:hypothetical protein